MAGTFVSALVKSNQRLNTFIIADSLKPCFQNLFVNSKRTDFFTLRGQYCVGAVKGDKLVMGFAAMIGKRLGEYRIDYNLKNNTFQKTPGHVDLTKIGPHDFYFFVYPASLPAVNQPSVHRATELLTFVYKDGITATDAQVGRVNLKNELARKNLTLHIETMVSAKTPVEIGGD